MYKHLSEAAPSVKAPSTVQKATVDNVVQPQATKYQKYAFTPVTGTLKGTQQMAEEVNEYIGALQNSWNSQIGKMRNDGQYTKLSNYASLKSSNYAAAVAEDYNYRFQQHLIDKMDYTSERAVEATSKFINGSDLSPEMFTTPTSLSDQLNKILNQATF